MTRHDRHLVLPEIGSSGQRRLAAGRVAIVGVGGLGSPAALYLAAAGVGTLGLIDGDTVDVSNLQRQIIHGEESLGEEKTVSAKRRLAGLDSEINIETFPVRLEPDNAADILSRFDLAIGCLDDFPARYLLNETCVKLGKPNVYGAASMFQGQASTFPPGGGPCYRCFFREPPPENRQRPPAERGVVSTLPGVIGCLQANEALKILLGIGRPLYGRLILFDALAASFREVALRPDPECPVCGGGQGGHAQSGCA